MNLTYSEVIRREPDHTHFDRPKPKKSHWEITKLHTIPKHSQILHRSPAKSSDNGLRNCDHTLNRKREHNKPKSPAGNSHPSKHNTVRLIRTKKNPDISIPLPASPAQHRGWHDIHRPRQHTSRVEEEEGRSRRQAELTGGTDLGARGRGNGRSAASSTSGSGDPAGARVAGADPTAGRCAVRLSRRGGASFFFSLFFSFFFPFLPWPLRA